MSDLNLKTEPHGPLHSRQFNKRRGAMMAGVAFAVLAVGAAAGAGGTRLTQRWQPQSVMLLQPAPIDKMTADSAVAVKGSVSEIFGNKFIVQDDSGRALVDLGPRGDDAKIVEKGEAVTIQGRFERGVVRAQVLVHSDGRSEAFGPPKPPRPDRGLPDRPGPRADRGPDRGPPPPPRDAERGPPPSDRGAPPPPPAQ